MQLRQKLLAVIACAAILPVTAAEASKKKSEPAYVMVNEEFGVPVFPYDITDKPYEVVGEVKAGIRKATIFSKAPSQEKVYRELWERAQKLGADAVVRASYGDPHVTAFSWGSVSATGIAVRFKKEAPAATAPAVPAMPAEPAATPQ